jgi:regulator of RNase E activity RraA
VRDGFAALLTELSPTCLLADAHPGVGVAGGFRTIDPADRVAGPALTVAAPPDALVDIVGVLARARPGQIVVIDCGGSVELAMWGGLMTTLARMAGVAGVVVDGAIRDVDELRAVGWPAWYRSAQPRRCPPAPPGTDLPVGATVRVGGVPVRSGDVVVADENGVAVVPVEHAPAALDGVRRLLAHEAVVRADIDSGATLAELFARFGYI